MQTVRFSPIEPEICKSRPGSTCISGPNAFAISVSLAVCVFASGCLSPLAKHASAFSAVAGSVIDNSEDAYRAAIKLRLDEQTAAAVYDYDKNPTWSPYKDFKPLLTAEQLDARIEVLDGLKAYAATLVDLTSSKPSSDLEAAAAGVGTNLRTLNQTAATAFKTAIPNAPVMSAANANVISTGVLALGEYLIARKVKGSLPKVTQDMNPVVQNICEYLNRDIADLRSQADVDYQNLIEAQDSFIRHQGAALSPIQHRDEVGKLLQFAAQQKANDNMLAGLQKALHTLAMTHQALAAAAQGNNPGSISQSIADLAAAGQSLKAFYKSLPAH